MLVTRIGTLTGTLELRRRLVGVYEFCIVTDLLQRSLRRSKAPFRTKLPLICQSRSNQKCQRQAVFGNYAEVSYPGGEHRPKV
jgi:hypothetical protein